MSANSFTIVVQGRLHKHTLARLQKLRAFGEVVYSHRVDDDTSQLSSYDTEGVTFVTYEKEVEDTTFNCFNTYYQFKSSLVGLEKVTTPWAIKIRSDNFYGNLEPLKEMVLANPWKFVSSNLYFRPDYRAKFHPSDQILAGSAELLREAYKIACWRCENQSKFLREAFNDFRMPQNTNYLYQPKVVAQVKGASVEMPRGVGTAPEVLLGTSCLAALQIVADPEKSKEQMQQAFSIIKIEDLGMYLGKEGTSHIPHDGCEIHNIMDL